MKTQTIRLTGRDYTREKVRVRDQHTCQLCKKKWVNGQRRFDVHHLEGLCGKLSRAYDRVEAMPHLITLCHRCHISKHVDRMKLQRRGENPLKGKTNDILTLIKKGKTYDAVGRRFGVSQAAISNHLKRHAPQAKPPLHQARPS